jgi:XTP/dITP diphosphohydrolase
VVLADPKGSVIATAEGRCHGVIANQPRGTGGFGYDPLFIVPEFGKTFGELSPEVKQSMSHRARAFAQLRPAIEREVR